MTAETQAVLPGPRCHAQRRFQRGTLGSALILSLGLSALPAAAAPATSGFVTYDATGTAFGEGAVNDDSSTVLTAVTVQAAAGLAVSTNSLTFSGDGHDGPSALSGYSVSLTNNGGQSWSTVPGLSSIAAISDPYIAALALFNGSLYVAGSNNPLSPQSPAAGNIYAYNGATFNTAFSTAPAGGVLSFAVFNGSLYAGTAKAGSILATSDGVDWASVTPAASEQAIPSLAVFNGSLYAGTSPDGEVYASADGAHWTVSLSGLGQTAVDSLAAFNGKLYAGLEPGGQVWVTSNGSTWTEAFAAAGESKITSLAVFNGKLYAGTYPDAKVIATADGSVWNTVFSGSGQAEVGALTVSGGQLFASLAPQGNLYSSPDGSFWEFAQPSQSAGSGALATFAGTLVEGVGSTLYARASLPASLTGSDGTTAPQLLTSTFSYVESQNGTVCGGVSPCAATNQVIFSVSDLAGNVTRAGPYAVLVDVLTSGALASLSYPANASFVNASPLLSWSPAPGSTLSQLPPASTFEAQVSRGDPTFASNVIVDASTPIAAGGAGAFQLAGLSDATTYYWRVRARNAASQELGPWSSPFGFETDFDSPTASGFETVNSTGAVFSETQFDTLLAGVTAQLTVQDSVSGLAYAPGSFNARISTDAGASWNVLVGTTPGAGPYMALSGTSGTTAPQTLAAYGLRFTESTGPATCGGVSPCAATNQVEFSVADLAGNVKTTGPYAVLIDVLGTGVAISTPAAPANGAFVNTARPLLSWTGPQGVPPGLLFELQGSANAAFTGTAAFDFTVPASVSSAPVPGALAAAATYYWRVRLDNPGLGTSSAWSQAYGFEIDLSSPVFSAFTLQSSSGALFTEGQIYSLPFVSTAEVTVQAAISGLGPFLGASGTLGLWRLNEGSGSTFYDSSGNGENGTLYDASWTSSPFGSAAQFNGSNAYGAVANTGFLPVGAAPRSMSGWFKTTQTGRTCEFGYGGGSWDTAFDLCSGINGDGNIYVINYNNGGSPVDISGHTFVADGNWHFASVTYDGTTESVYVDGVLDTSVAETLNTGNVSGNPFTLGRQAYSDSGNYHYFSGAIAQVRLLSYGETAAQVAADFALGYPVPPVQVSNNGGATWAVVASTFGPGPYFSLSGSTGTTAPQTLALRRYRLVQSTSAAVCAGADACAATNQIRFGASDLARNAAFATYAAVVDLFGTGLAVSTPAAPADGAETIRTPSFSWTGPSTTTYFPAVPAGSTFELQVSNDDPTFASTVLDVSTPIASASGGAWMGGYTPSAPLTDMTTYYWRVRAKSGLVAADASPWSSTASFTTQGAAPVLAAFESFGPSGSLSEGQVNPLIASVTAQVTVQDTGSGIAFSFGGPLSAVPGTVGLWHFDDGSGTSASDSSGNGNTGTLENGAAWQTSGCVFGDCIAVSGSGSNPYVLLPAPALGNGAPFTISLWVNPVSASGILDQVASSSNGGGWCTPFLGFNGSGQLVGELWYGGGDSYATTTNAVSSGTWTYLTMTWSSGSGISLYLNGQPAGSNPSATTYSASGSADYMLLGSPNGVTNCERTGGMGSGNFDGSLDEARVLSYAETPSQVAADYAFQLASPPAQLSTNGGHSWTAIASTSGPGPYYSLTGSAGTTAPQTLSVYNLSLNESLNSTTCGGAAPCAATNQVAFFVPDVAGQVSSATYAIQVDAVPTAAGVSTPTLPANGAFLAAQPTLAWAIPPAAAGLGTGSGFQLQLASGSANFTSPLVNVLAPASVSTYTTAGLSNGATYFWRVSLKNALTGSQSAASSVASFETDFGSPTLGGFASLGPAGALEAETQWNDLAGGVTAQIIAQDAAAGLVLLAPQPPQAISGTAALWPFNEGSGSVVHDASGNGNTGTLGSGITWGAGPPGLGGALEFPGSADVTFASVSGIPTGNPTYTLEAWINVAAGAQGNNNGIIGWGAYGGNGGNDTIAFRTNSCGGATFGLDNYWWNDDLISPCNLNTNTWYLVAATFDGARRTLYVNGAQVAQDQPSGHNVPYNYNLTVGKTCCSEYFDGAMSQVRVLDVALSASQIAADYAGQLGNMSASYTTNGGASWTRVASTAPGSGPYLSLSSGAALAAPQTLALNGVSLSLSTNAAVCAGHSPCAAVNQVVFDVTSQAGLTSQAGPYAILYDPSGLAYSSATPEGPLGLSLSPQPAFSWMGMSTATAAGFPPGVVYRLEVSSADATASSHFILDITTPLAVNPALATADGSYVSTATLANHTTYYWRVRPETAFEPGVFSATASFVTQFLAAPVAVASPFAPVGYSSVTVSWSAGSLTAGTTYLLEASGDGFATVADSTLTLNTSATLGLTGALSADATYSFQVQTESGAAMSLPLALGTTATLPAPVEPLPYSLGGDALIAQWGADGNSPQTVYTAVISPGGQSVVVATGPAPGVFLAQFNGLTTDTQYTVSVQASGIGGSGGFVSLGATTTLSGLQYTGQPANVVLGEPNFTTTGGTNMDPLQAAFDPQGDLWLADGEGGDDQIDEFTAPLASTGLWENQNTDNNGKFSNPQGVAFDAQGNQWVADNATGNIFEFAPPYNGTPVVTFNPNNSVPGGLYWGSNPSAMSFDPAGNLWVADGDANVVWEYSPPFSMGMAPNLILGAASFDSLNTGSDYCHSGYFDSFSVCNPYGVAVDASGDVWVSDTGGDRVLEFKPPFSNGMAATLVLGQQGFDTISPFSCSTPGVAANALCNPLGLSFGPGGALWVSDSSLNRVVEFKPPFSNGMKAASALGQPNANASLNNCAAAGPGTFCSPDSVVVDASGNAWVSDGGNERVLGFGANYASPPAASGTPIAQVAFTSATVQWAAGSYPAGTAFTVSASSDDFQSVQFSSVTLNLYASFSALAPDTTYWFQVAAASGSGTSAPLSLGRIVTLSPAPGPGSIVSEQGDGLTAQWASNGVAGQQYLLAASTVALSGYSATPPAFTVSTGTQATIPLLAPLTPYYVAVEAVNFAGVASSWTALGSTVSLAAQPILPAGNDSAATVVLGEPDFTSIQNGLDYPTGAAFDPDGNLWVADAGTDNVYEFTPPYTGAGFSPAVTDNLEYPYGVAFDPQGNLWVIDNYYDPIGNGALLEFSPPFSNNQTPAAVVPFGPTFCYASALAFDGAGNAYVADPCDGAVLIFTESALLSGQNAATYLGAFNCSNPPPTPTANTVCEPDGLAFDKSGNLWVSDQEYGRVVEFAAPFTNGKPAATALGAAGTGSPGFCDTQNGYIDGTTLCGPAGLGFDAAGNLWVSDDDLSRVTRFSPPFSNGAAATQELGQPNFLFGECNSDTGCGQASPYDLNDPNAVAFDPQGSVWVSDTSNGRVLGYVSDVTATPAPGPAAAVWVSSATLSWSPGANLPGTVYMAQASVDGFQTVEASAFTQNNSASLALQPATPYSFRVGTMYAPALGMRPAATLTAPVVPGAYLASTNTVTAQWSSPNGPGVTFLAILSTAPSPSTNGASGNVSDATPYLSALFAGLAPDTTYFVDVQALGPAGPSPFTPLGPVRTAPVTPGPVGNGPAAVAVLGDTDFVGDSSQDPAASLYYPAADAFDSAGDHWVADTEDNRVLGFAPGAPIGAAASVVLGQPDFTSSNYDVQNMEDPDGVAVDARGDVWVSDQYNDRVLEFTPPFSNGQPPALVLGQSGDCNTSPNGLCDPGPLAFDAAGDLWVADSENGRVLEFTPPFATNMPASLVAGVPSLSDSNECNNSPAPNDFCYPYGLSFDSSGNLWVGDPGFSRVQEFPPPFSNGMNAALVLGEPDMTSVSYQGGPNGFNSPLGVTAAPDGSLWVVDNDNSRALHFQPPFSNGMNAAQVVGQPDFTTTGCDSAGAASASDLCYPEGVSLDPTGALWVDDTDNSRVLGYPSAQIAPPLVTAAPVLWVSSAAVSWGAAPELPGTSYVVTVLLAGSETVVSSASVSGTSLTVNLPPVPGASYAIQVTAVNGAYQSQPVLLGTVTLPVAPPQAAPFGGVSPDSLRAAWTSPDAAGTLYQVFLSTGAQPQSNGFAANQSTATTLSVYEFAGLSPSTQYFAAVQAVGVDGSTSAFTQLGSTVTLPARPLLPSDAAANVVLGQPNFAANECDSDTGCDYPTASDLSYPAGAAVDANGTVWVADYYNCRVVGYPAPASNGEASAVVLGEPDFTSDNCNLNQSGLNEPESVAVDARGDLWVADQDNSRVLEFKPPFSNGMNAALVLGAADFTSYGCGNVEAGQLCGPSGLGFDASGNLWVADSEFGRVLEFSPPFVNSQSASLVVGAPDFVTDNECDAIPGSQGSTFCYPAQVAFDASGGLWVADQGDSRVLDFAPPLRDGMSASLVLGQPDLGSLNSEGGPAGLSYPQGLGFGAGSLWVADSNNNRVLRFDPPFANGQPATLALGQPDLTTTECDSDTGCDASTASDLSYPTSVFFDKSGNGWVADQDNSRVLGYLAAPAPVAAVGSPAATVYVSSAALSWSAGANPSGTTYIVEASLDGFASVASSFTTTATFFTFSSLLGNATYSFRLEVVTSSGPAAPVALGAGYTPLRAPSSSAFSGVTANALTANWTGNNAPGTLYDVLLSSAASPAANGLSGNQSTSTFAAGAAFSGLSPGTLYYAAVSALGGGAQSAYVSLGSTQTTAPAALPGQNDPAAALVAGQENFTSGSEGVGPQSLDEPLAGAFDAAGNLWVVDSGNCRVVEYPAPYAAGAQAGARVVLGQPDLNTGCYGSNASIFGEGLALAFDARGNLWVADEYNGRLAEFSPPFTNGQAPLGSFYPSNGAVDPEAVAFDSSGDVWVSDDNLGNLDEYTPAALTSGGPPTTSLGDASRSCEGGATDLCYPRSLSFDASGDLWVADTYNQRLVEFTPPFVSTIQPVALVLGQSGEGDAAANAVDEPYGVALDRSGSVWVADAYNDRVLEFAKPFSNTESASLVVGQPNFTTRECNSDTGCGNPTASDLYYPTGVAFDPYGSLWVADEDNSRMLGYATQLPTAAPAPAANSQLAPAATSVSASWAAAPGASAYALSAYPNGAAVPALTVDVAGLSGAIGPLLPNTTYAFTVSALLNGLYAGPALALGSAQTLAAAPQGLAVSDIGGDFLELAWSSATDAPGTLYRAALSTGPAPGTNGFLGDAFSTTTADSVVFSGLRPGATYFAAVQAINALGAATPFSGAVSAVTLAPQASPYSNGQAATLVLGEPDFVTEGCGLDAYSLCGPRQSAFDAAGDQWVADYGNNRVVEYLAPVSSGAPAAVVLGQANFTTANEGLGAASLSQPTALALDGAGNVWVSDTGNNRVLMFNSAALASGASATLVLGAPDLTTAGGGDTASQFQFPVGLAFDASGDLWVADTSNGRVLEFQPPFSNGMNAALVLGYPFLSGSNGCDYPSPTNLCGPTYAGFDPSGRLWVTDEGFDRVLAFTPPFFNGMNASLVVGEPDLTTDNPSPAQDAVGYPQGVAFSANGALWVTDDRYNRALEFEPPFSNGMNAALVLGQPNFTSSTPDAPNGVPAAANLGASPEGITLDANGSPWIADYGNGRVLGYVTNAAILAAMPKPPASAPVLTSAALGVSSITLTWTSISGVLGYDLYTPQGMSFYSSPTTYIQTGLPANTLSGAYVAGLNAAGVEGPYANASAYTLALPATGLALVGAGISSAAFTWGGNGNPAYTSYQLDYWIVGGSTVTQAVVSATTGTLSGLNGGTTYYVDVQAVNGNGIASALTGSPVRLVTLPLQAAVVTIGAGGGMVPFSPSQGNIIVTIPPGAFVSSVTVTVETPQLSALPPPNSAAVTETNTDVAMQILLGAAVQPSAPVEIELSYSGSDLSAFNPADLVIAQYDPAEGVWVPLPSTVNQTAQVVTAYATTFLGNTNSLASTDALARLRTASVTGSAGLFQIMGVRAAASLSSAEAKVFPNPFRPALGESYVTFSNLPANTTVRVYDILGEKVGELSADAAGIATWNGRNMNGNACASGVYFVLAGSGSSRVTLKLAIQR